MARRPLDNNEQFPAIEGVSVSQGELATPEYTSESWSVLIFYRGHW